MDGYEPVRGQLELRGRQMRRSLRGHLRGHVVDRRRNGSLRILPADCVRLGCHPVHILVPDLLLLLRHLEKVQAGGGRDRLRPVLHVKTEEQVLDVALDRAIAQAKATCDHRVRIPLRNEMEHLELPPR